MRIKNNISILIMILNELLLIFRTFCSADEGRGTGVFSLPLSTEFNLLGL